MTNRHVGKNVLDHFYPQCPRNLDDVCLYDFIKWYEYSGTDANGQRTYRKRTKAWLPNHKLYDPSNEQQREDYFYSLILLYIPFRNESDLIGKQETAEAALSRQLSANPMLSGPRRWLGAGRSQDCYGRRLPTKQLSIRAVNIDDMVAKLQVRVFDRTVTHLLHQKRHENCQCTCSCLQPLYMLLSGVGGTGKSFLIHTLKAKLLARFHLDSTMSEWNPSWTS